MSKLIDIAKECGAEKHVPFNKNGIHETGKILITPDQLRATVEQVAGPLVEALNAMNAIFDADGDHSQSDADAARAKSRNSLAAYTEIMGEKK